ncbi:Major facilitator superfamily [Carpediemonas membranifera]|uniref:Lysosomal dipeptide transporter MFSD1 n=1 Tax=Carpediemonas membranifera TaxID=201153 RepID=A0A8J6B0H7_9EUKA|nr:Major facilitator superfamily [Carpediemonas membranifera]|eukprot:KAG9390377.1 Major facilitator superfamily [Carpediemonas membranifera]
MNQVLESGSRFQCPQPMPSSVKKLPSSVKRLHRAQSGLQNHLPLAPAVVRSFRVPIYLVLFVVVNILFSWGNDAYFSLQSFYKDTYGFSSIQLSVLSSIYSLPNCLIPIIFGVLVDRFGASKSFAGSTIFMVIGVFFLMISGLPSSSLIAFVILLISRVSLAFGGQSIYTSHDVLNLKIFGVGLVSLTLSSCISAGKVGSAAVFQILSRLAVVLGLRTTALLSGIVFAPTAFVAAAILILHANDRRKKKHHTNKTVSQVSTIVSMGSIPVPIRDYATDSDNDDYLVLSSYPQTPAEFRSGYAPAEDDVEYGAKHGVAWEKTGSVESLGADVETSPQSPVKVIVTETMKSELTHAPRFGSRLDFGETDTPPEEQLPADEETIMDEYRSPEPDDARYKDEAASHHDGLRSDSELDSEASLSDDLVASVPFDPFMSAVVDQLHHEDHAERENDAAQVDIALRQTDPDSLWSNRFYWWQLLTASLMYGLFYSFPSVAGAMMQGRNNLSNTEATSAASFYYFAMILTPIWVVVVGRLGQRCLFMIAILALSIIVFCLILFTRFSPNFMAFLIGLCASPMGSAVYSTFALTVSPKVSGIAYGIFNAGLNATIGGVIFMQNMLAGQSWKLGVMTYIGHAVVALCAAFVLFLFDQRTGARLSRAKQAKR